MHARMDVLRNGGMVLSMMLFGGLLPIQAHTQVNINVNIGPPAPVVVEAPPQMLYLSDPGVYVAVGIPYDVYFVDGRYYYFHGEQWFWARGYRGPWTYVEYRTLPGRLRKYHVIRLREYRDREYKVYRVQGASFKGKHFNAVDDDDHDDGHGKGHGRGHGKDH
jgi:hypothetical protein